MKTHYLLTLIILMGWLFSGKTEAQPVQQTNLPTLYLPGGGGFSEILLAE